MTDDQNPDEQLGDEVVLDDDQSEATENTEGQEEGQPAEAPEGAEDETVSKSKARRERRKAREAALEAEAKDARDKARELQERLKAAEEARSQSKPPKVDDFQNYDEYIAALSAHKSGEMWDQRQYSQMQDQAKAERARLDRIAQDRNEARREAWKAQVEEASTRYADFNTVFNDDVPVTEVMATLIARSDVGADVAYYLGTNRQEAAQIAQISQGDPLEAARIIGSIEARLSVPKPRKATNSPDPINPARGGASATKDPAKMSMAEFRAWREAGGTF